MNKKTINIPYVGQIVKLTKDVSLVLEDTSQNSKFLKELKKLNGNIQYVKKGKYPISINKGAILTIDRVYVRAGHNSVYDSITFKVKDVEGIPNGRFFVSLKTANEMELEPLEEKNLSQLTLSEYINHLRKEDNHKECYFYYLHNLERESLQSIQVKIKPREILDITKAEIEKYLMEDFEITLEQAMEEIISDLKSDCLNIDKKISHTAKDSLRILNEDHKDTNYEYLSNLYDDNYQVNHSEFTLIKLSDEYDIKKPYLISFDVTYSNDDYEKLLPIIDYMGLMTYVHSKIRHIRNTSDYRFNSKISKIKKILEDTDSATSVFLDTYDAGYSYYKTSNSRKVNNYPDIYIPYEKMRHFHLLNAKGYYGEVERMGLCYYQGQTPIDLKEARRLIIKAKKAN